MSLFRSKIAILQYNLKSLVQQSVSKLFKFVKLAQLTLSITEIFPGPVTNTFLANSFLPSDFDGYAVHQV